MKGFRLLVKVTKSNRPFQFGTKTVEWAGFKIGEKLVRPLQKHTEAIKSFPTPLNITDLSSFMELLQQVAYCYATAPATVHLRHLLKPSEPWDRSEDVHIVFVRAKEIIANKVEDGVRLFNPKLPSFRLVWGGDGGWDTFYAENIAAAQIRMISTVVKKHGKSAV